MLDRIDVTARRTKDAGFALILAILALLLLTFLGLTMAVSTSTELQIAQNYRWSQQALYNAEAGLEIGKYVLQTAQWANILPQVRGTNWDGVTAPNQSTPGATALNAHADAWGNPSRNFENFKCDRRGNGVGYGAVLDVGDASSPYQYVSTFGGQTLDGAVTIWVRRLLKPDPTTGNLTDVSDPDESSLVLTAEGVAPYTGATASSAFGQSRRAVQVMELTLSKIVPIPCTSRSGQTGGSHFGAGFGGCAPLEGSTDFGNGAGKTNRKP
jgi:Tfp pilus assembly protein PilX